MSAAQIPPAEEVPVGDSVTISVFFTTAILLRYDLTSQTVL